MVNICCYLAGIIMLVPAFILDTLVKIVFLIYCFGYMLIMAFINPSKIKYNFKDSYEYKVGFGWNYYFCSEVIDFYFKD